ncbi:hypothetical protein [Streptomyces sp. NBC_00401]|uniref:hypothetical protein n=1 Tax=Streptomyces sp. NBC_00401 TaxID=2975738 RepID=UPI00225604FF|nr:hypothetical protein [Streptomyces sp. NBC_00401]MCX5080145.1 hypothetical protein [Streptomyces sp. NBC_00401]
MELKDLTAEGLLHCAVEAREHGLAGEDIKDRTFAAALAWPVLHDMGHFPESVPRTLRGAVTRGRLAVGEAVDRHQLRHRAVRDLLVRVKHLRRRRASMDCSTRRNTIHQLVKLWWKQIGEINPHVLAQVIRRHRDEHGTVPVCQRYDRQRRPGAPISL